MSADKQKPSNIGYLRSGQAKIEENLRQLDHIDQVSRESKHGVDLENAFQIYCGFAGDVERTALTLGVDVSIVSQISEELKWPERIKSLLELKKSGRPGDLERAISRASNFVIAHRMRIVLQRMVNRLYLLTDDQLFEQCYTQIIRGVGSSQRIEKVLNCKPFSDLCAALEKMASMTYAALNDTVTERTSRDDDKSDTTAVVEVHALIQTAMAEVLKAPSAADADAKLKSANGKSLPPSSEQADVTAAMAAPAAPADSPI
jgi:hypothetical protein